MPPERVQQACPLFRWQCVAVVSFGSSSQSTKLHELSGKEEKSLKRLADVVAVCQYFGNKLFEIVYEKA